MHKTLRTIISFCRGKDNQAKCADRCIFIHINKTGGSSVKNALGLEFEHKSAKYKIKQIGRQRWDEMFTFSFVRNPWDKVVSHYFYRVKTNQTNLHSKPVSFKDWVQLAYAQKDPKYHDNPIMFMPQSDWLTDDEGELLVNFVGRFENLQADFDYICARLNCKADLPHKKKTNRQDYHIYYDEESRQIIAECFKKDIERFGYTF